MLNSCIKVKLTQSVKDHSLSSCREKKSAAAWKRSPLSRRQFLTSDYIVDETVTLLLVRHSHEAAADFLQTVRTSESLRLEWVSRSLVVLSGSVPECQKAGG